jgi:hypothetical protein
LEQAQTGGDESIKREEQVRRVSEQKPAVVFEFVAVASASDESQKHIEEDVVSFLR